MGNICAQDCDINKFHDFNQVPMNIGKIKTNKQKPVKYKKMLINNMCLDQVEFDVTKSQHSHKFVETIRESDSTTCYSLGDAPSINDVSLDFKEIKSIKSSKTPLQMVETNYDFFNTAQPSYLTPRDEPKSFFSEVEDNKEEAAQTDLHSNIFDICESVESLSVENLFDQVNLNRVQTAKILREQIAKFDVLTNPDYGFRIRFSHLKHLTQALHGSFEEIINTRDEEYHGFKQQGKFFQLKDQKTLEKEKSDDSEEELKMGEDFHNPNYDDKLVHPLGRFNQAFTLFKGMYVDQDVVNWCQSSVGQKKGPYPLAITLPIESRMTEKLDLALDQIKSKNASRFNPVPTLFIMGVQHFDKFNGKLMKNKENDVMLNQGFKVYVLQVQKIMVEEDTMLANYLTPGNRVTVVYLFSD